MARTDVATLQRDAVPPSVEHRAPAGRRRIMVVLGTRPEGIKLAPLVLAIGRSPHLAAVTVVTGQHREMLDPVLDLFAITPDVDLDIMAAGQSLAEISVRTLQGLSPVVAAHRPDALVVQGDTTAALMGALAAFYARVPVVHLEAGLRSGNVAEPFPEELNRRMISQLASLHLAATEDARLNLLLEGTEASSISVVGNTVIDALAWSIAKRVPYGDPRLESLDHDRRRVILVTAHRRESWGPKMRAVGQAVADVARAEPDAVVVLPIHRNPVVRDAIVPQVAGLENVWVREPLDYGPFARLLGRADLLLTDSGGLQEEGPTLGTPVLVMRDTTERPEALQAGSVRLVGTDRHRIATEVLHLLHDRAAYRAMAVPRPVYGDGLAAERSVAALEHLFGLGDPPVEFAGYRPPLAVLR